MTPIMERVSGDASIAWPTILRFSRDCVAATAWVPVSICLPSSENECPQLGLSAPGAAFATDEVALIGFSAPELFIGVELRHPAAFRLWPKNPAPVPMPSAT